MEETSLQGKKEISKYAHRLMNEGRYEELEEFLLDHLESGDRSTIILGSLINLYKCQKGKWGQVEKLAREYLELKPKNSFAKSNLELALKKQHKVQEQPKAPKRSISDFRRKMHDGIITIQNVSEEEFVGFSEFEKSMLLAELYSYVGEDKKAVQALRQAEGVDETTEEERKIIRQAIQLVSSVKRNVPIRRIKWNSLPFDERNDY